MTVRRLIIAVGAVLLVAGVIGLLVPVSVSNTNGGGGGTVSCGNGFATNLSSARNANDQTGANIPILNQIVPHTDFVTECQAAVNSRRMWAIPLAVIGVLGIAGAFVVRPRATATAR